MTKKKTLQRWKIINIKPKSTDIKIANNQNNLKIFTAASLVAGSAAFFHIMWAYIFY